MNKVYLGLGTNLGDRLNYLNCAVEILSGHEEIKLVNKSKIYETKAWGYKDQPDFLNMNIEIYTNLSAKELLNICNKVETKLNRERLIRWGPRTIDIDILFFNDIILEDKDLIIPHPRITERAFVMYPLIDLNESLYIDDKTIKQHLNSLTKEERNGVKEFIGNEE